MTVKANFEEMIINKDLSDPVEKLCFDALSNVLFSQILSRATPEDQRYVLAMLTKTGPNKT